VPDRLHLGPRLRLVHPEHIPAIPVEERGDPVVRDAVHVHPSILQLLRDPAALLEVLGGRILKIDRDVDVSHAETGDARRLVREGLLVGVKPEIDDMADAERPDVGELRLGRLSGGGDAVVKPPPMIDRFRVGHRTSRSA
jgi:hypothetical protein